MEARLTTMSKSQFANFFEPLRSLIIEERKPCDDYFLVGVDITDRSESDEIVLGFEVEYGPVARYYSDNIDDVKCEMLSCRLEYVFGKDGLFRRYEGMAPGNDGADFYPECNPPEFEDFPDPEDIDVDLFGAVRCIISKCMKCGKMLNSIQFRTSSPEFDYDYYPFIPATYDSPEEPCDFRGWSKGMCLKKDLLDSYKYSYALKKSRVEGEYDLIFYVKEK